MEDMIEGKSSRGEEEKLDMPDRNCRVLFFILFKMKKNIRL